MSRHPNFRPDFQSWYRMIEAWNRREAAFAEVFTTWDLGIFARVVNEPGVTVVQSSISSFGRTTLLIRIKGRGKTPEKRRRRTAWAIVDSSEEDPVHVFVKAETLRAMSDAVFLLSPPDRGDFERIGITVGSEDNDKDRDEGWAEGF